MVTLSCHYYVWAGLCLFGNKGTLWADCGWCKHTCNEYTLFNDTSGVVPSPHTKNVTHHNIIASSQPSIVAKKVSVVSVLLVHQQTVLLYTLQRLIIDSCSNTNILCIRIIHCVLSACAGGTWGARGHGSSGKARAPWNEGQCILCIHSADPQ